MFWDGDYAVRRARAACATLKHLTVGCLWNAPLSHPLVIAFPKGGCHAHADCVDGCAKLCVVHVIVRMAMPVAQTEAGARYIGAQGRL